MDTRIRRIYLAALAVAVAAGVAVPLVRHVRDARDAAATEHVAAVAAALADPPGLRPVTTGCALRGPGTVRCARTPEGTRRLAGEAQRALTAAAGRPATLTCEPLGRPEQATPGMVSCWTQVLSGEHSVSVSMTTLVDRTGAAARIVGSDYVVQAG